MGASHDKLREIFYRYDTSGDGFLDPTEVSGRT